MTTVGPPLVTTGLDAYVPQLVLDWLDAGGTAPVPLAEVVHGSLVFADVSGFTPLSERLARKGRVGSEELTDILNRIFGRLLDVASGYGGDLLKYGGDALLLLFRGEGHPARAAVAAATMQRALRSASRIDTGSGIVRLRMSVGVHSGELLFVLVGTSHRELLLAGPGATTTVRMEAAAEADEVLVSASTAAALDPRWLGGEKAGGALLKLTRADEALPIGPFARRLTDRAWLAVPTSLRGHLASGAIEGEHRQATVGFAQFKGTDGLLADEGPSAVAAELHRIIESCQRAAERHDVTFLATDLDADGGKVLFSTGAPSGGVHDSDRMVLAMRDIAAHRSRLMLRVGVNRGPAFAVDVGAPYRRTYAVMGDTTNLAARVMGKADPRSVLATTAVTEDLRAEFELTPLDPFMVKGKSRLVTAFEVGPPIAARRARREEAVPVIGHDGERDALDRAVVDAEAGTGGAIAIIGGAGLGKTRLVAHLLDTAREHPVLLVEGGQYATHNPYFALRPGLRSLIDTSLSDDEPTVVARLQQVVAVRAPHLEVWLPLLNDALGVTMAPTHEVSAIEPRFRRARVASVLVELLGAVLAGPAVVVVEDAQWLDDSSAEVLRSVVDAAPERSWIVCVTSRELNPLGLDGSKLDVRRLEPLDDGESRELLYRLLDDKPMPPAVISAIAERGAGNPLFLMQLLDSARSGQGVDALPDSLEALMAARIDNLPSELRNLLRSASVLGVRFPLRTLASVLADDGDGSGDEGTLRLRIGRLYTFVSVDGTGTGRFRTPLVRQVAYETLPFRRRRELHRRAATVLEAAAAAGGERPVALMSLHFHAAEQHEPAWAYAREAADLAADRHAAVEAAALYGRALSSAKRLRAVPTPELARIWAALGEQAEYAGEGDAALAAFATARALLRDDAPALAAVMLKDGWLRERSRDYRGALHWYTRARRTLEALPADVDSLAPARRREVERLHAELVLQYGAVRLRQGHFADGLRWLERAVDEVRAMAGACHDAAAADPADAPGADLLAHAYYLLDWALTDLGRPGDAARYRELALPIYERLGDLSGQANVLNNLGIDAYYEGRWDEALGLYERSRRARERSGDVVQLGLAANNIGEILSDQGKLAEAEALFRDALRVWRGSHFQIGDGVATSNLGRVASRAGRFEEAHARFSEAVAIFDAVGAASFRADVDARIAECLLFADDPRAALAAADGVCEQFDRSGAATPAVMSMAHRVAALSLALTGDSTGSLRRIDSAVQIAEQSSAEYELALALEVRARVLRRVGDGGAAEPFDIAAATLFDRLGVESTPFSRLGPLADDLRSAPVPVI